MTEARNYAASWLAGWLANLIVAHLGCASAIALASTMIPIVISVLMAVQTPGINVIGMAMLLQYVVGIGFILPVNSPQAMIACGTGTFTAQLRAHRLRSHPGGHGAAGDFLADSLAHGGPHDAVCRLGHGHASKELRAPMHNSPAALM